MWAGQALIRDAIRVLSKELILILPRPALIAALRVLEPQSPTGFTCDVGNARYEDRLGINKTRHCRSIPYECYLAAGENGPRYRSPSLLIVAQTPHL